MDKQNNLDKKKFFVKNLSDSLLQASAVVIVDPSGFTVKTQQELKKRLKSVGATMTIVKNTLLKLAGTQADMDKGTLSDEVLSGPTALVLASDDPIAPLQVLAKFASEFEIPNMKAGIVEGSFQDKNALLILSKLPGKKVLYTQVVGSLASPLYGTVGVLQANLQKLVYILHSASKQ